MKKTVLLLICACLLLPTGALGERLTLSVEEHFACDAEMPGELPQSLPVLTASPATIDPEKAIDLLMPGKGQREDLPGGDVTVGVGDGEHEYILINKNEGRIFYVSEYVSQHLLDLMSGRNRMINGYLPTDVALDFMTPDEAVQVAADLMRQLGIEVATDSAMVYTLEQASFAEVQAAMRESEWLAYTPRKRALRSLEPLAPEHEGYWST